MEESAPSEAITKKTQERVLVGKPVERADMDRIQPKTHLTYQPTMDDLDKMAREEGYRKGYQVAKEELQHSVVNDQFRHRYWRPPVVQTVRVPGMVIAGTYIPEHEEQVVLRPGQYDQYHELDNDKYPSYKIPAPTPMDEKSTPPNSKTKKVKTPTFEQWMDENNDAKEKAK